MFALHGGPANDHRGLGEYLDAIAAYRSLYLLDARGCGESADAPVESYTLARLAEDVEDTRLAIGEEKVDLLGHSFGGLVALTYALRWPFHVRSLILVSSPVRGWRSIVTTPSSWSVWLRTILLAMRAESDFTSFHLKYEVGNAGRRDAVRDLLEQPTRYDPARVRPLMSMAALDAASVLAAGVPITGIYGRQDRRFAGDAAYLRRIGAKLVHFDACGHFPLVEQSEDFHRAVRTALGSCATVT